MEIRTLKAAQLTAADYNPRRDLQPEDAEYQKLRRSIETFGYIEPIIWNERTGRVVGGHQRLKVLLEQGREDIEAVVVDLAEKDEKILNVLLNKVKGRWDIGKLADLLAELGDDAPLTGFTQAEIDSLTNDIDSLIDGDTVDEELRAIEEFFNVSLTFDKADREELKAYVKDYGKEALIEAIIQKAKGEI